MTVTIDCKTTSWVSCLGNFGQMEVAPYSCTPTPECVNATLNFSQRAHQRVLQIPALRGQLKFISHPIRIIPFPEDQNKSSTKKILVPTQYTFGLRTEIDSLLIAVCFPPRRIFVYF